MCEKVPKDSSVWELKIGQSKGLKIGDKVKPNILVPYIGYFKRVIKCTDIWSQQSVVSVS